MNELGDNTNFATFEGRSLAWLLQEEDHLQRHLSTIRSQINQINPACCLPEDILVEIFVIIAWSWSWSWGKHWVGITCVCRRWRDTALRSQLLWTSIDPRNEHFTWLALRRAGNAPLRLVSPVIVRDISNNMRMIATLHTNRFVEVNLSLTLSALARSAPIWDKGWKSLRSLVLKQPPNHDYDDGEDDENCPLDLIRLPISFETDPPPNLQHLKLQVIYPRTWGMESKGPFLMYHNLRTLHFHRHVNVRRSPTVDRIMMVLANAPLLEDLLLVDSGPMEESLRPVKQASRSGPRKSVEMKRLRRLALSFEETTTVRNILEHLSIPETTHVFLHGRYYSPIRGFMACLPEDRSNLEFLRSMASVELKMAKGYVTLAGYHNGHEAAKEPCLKIMSWKTADETANRMFHSALQIPIVFSHTSLRSLHLVLTIPFAVPWDDVLETLETLESLTVLLCHPPSAERRDDDRYIVFKDLAVTSLPPPVPQLKTLRLLHYKRTPDFREALWECMHSRWEAGFLPPSFELWIDDQLWKFLPPSPLKCKRRRFQTVVPGENLNSGR